MAEPVSNGKSGGWLPAGTVLALLGSIGGVSYTQYAADRQQDRDDIKALQTAQVSAAHWDGTSSERIAHVESLSQVNRERIEAAFLELDTKIQREFNLADDTLRSELRSLDERLQEEIGRSALERQASIGKLWDEVLRLREWIDTNRNKTP